MQRRLLISFVAVTLSLSCAASASEWQRLSTADAEPLIATILESLEQHWNASAIGWCRAETVDANGSREVFTYWWNGDLEGYQLVDFKLVRNRDLLSPPKLPFIAVSAPTEHWSYTPTTRTCMGYDSQKHACPIPMDCRLHPHRFWLNILNGQVEQLALLKQIRNVRTKGTGLSAWRHPSGTLRLESRIFTMDFDPAKGFCPVVVEYQTRLDQLSKPELRQPRRYEFTLAQDEHGVWYCSQSTTTVWPKGGRGTPRVTKSPRILEYHSQPAKQRLRFTYSDLNLPAGTHVKSSAPSRVGNWVVAEEDEG